MDGTVRIWNAATEGSLALVMRGSEWIAYDKKGYFDASRNGGGLAGLSLGPESYRIDQFAAKYNRPDIVLAEAGLGTKSQLEHYRKQYERRLAKLGLDEKSLGPESKVPRAKIERLDRRDREVALRIGFEGSDSDLKSYSVYGERRAPLRRRGKAALRKEGGGRREASPRPGRQQDRGFLPQRPRGGVLPGLPLRGVQGAGQGRSLFPRVRRLGLQGPGDPRPRLRAQGHPGPGEPVQGHERTVQGDQYEGSRERGRDGEEHRGGERLLREGEARGHGGARHLGTRPARQGRAGDLLLPDERREARCPERERRGLRARGGPSHGKSRRGTSSSSWTPASRASRTSGA